MSRAAIRDLVERAGFTFLQAFLGVFVFTGTVADLDAARAAAIAGIAAVLALLKGAVALAVSGTLSPASLAPAPHAGGPAGPIRAGG